MTACPKCDGYVEQKGELMQCLKCGTLYLIRLEEIKEVAEKKET